ncbi:hypothetical protein BDN70DRAFT_939469 [Pholiota conissans]|uniref:Uncharacterized protein n=1 Tax=Pholiota conissans TaxID=109636 RepID=A0A9P5YNB6_9AGAR|nr:hypothetical protein BDN70DRAFT_939469 [Pholiota conissans]
MGLRPAKNRWIVQRDWDGRQTLDRELISLVSGETATVFPTGTALEFIGEMLNEMAEERAPVTPRHGPTPRGRPGRGRGGHRSTTGREDTPPIEPTIDYSLTLNEYLDVARATIAQQLVGELGDPRLGEYIVSLHSWATNSDEVCGRSSFNHATEASKSSKADAPRILTLSSNTSGRQINSWGPLNIKDQFVSRDATRKYDAALAPPGITEFTTVRGAFVIAATDEIRNTLQNAVTAHPIET